MDSFYDGPRRAPPPMSRGMLNADPVVPEISVLAPTNGPRNTFTPYAQWKSHQATTQRHFIPPSNKENFTYMANSQQNNSILKKQVRFVSPRDQARMFESNKISAEPKSTKVNESIPSFAKGNYLAELPSRKLDLSVIDLTKNTPPPAKKEANHRPRNYKEFLEQQAVEEYMPPTVFEDDSVTDIFNYKRKSQISEDVANTVIVAGNDPQECRGRTEPQMPQADSHLSNQQENHKTNKESQTICNCSSQKSSLDNDFTVKDLLKIIAQQSQQISQQNSQLLSMQQQISELALMQKNQEMAWQKSVSSPCCSRERCWPLEDDYCKRNADYNRREWSNKMRCVTSSQHEKNAEVRPQQKFMDGMSENLPNFSIGMTTSFEVAFRNKPAQNQMQSEQIPFVNQKPTVEIQEITDNDHVNKNQIEQFTVPKNNMGNKETLVDTSMVFKEPIRVREQCPSPEPSIRIDMNDFDDSDSEDSSEVEVSFYRNLMTQVNKILKKAQIETVEDVMGNGGAAKLNNRTMHKIKEATLRQLREIGVNLPEMEDSRENDGSDIANERSYDQEDISFAVKQLLMKYLPADHLARVSSKPKMNPERVLAPNNKAGAIKNRPEFSFATVQYMKKYNLIANSNKEFNLPQKEKQAHSPKILDISKLKQQPKLF